MSAATRQNQQSDCAPSEDSDQPGHPPSLISVFAVRMEKARVLSYPLSAQRRLIRLGGCPGWSESSLGAQSLCWFCHVTAHVLLYAPCDCPSWVCHPSSSCLQCTLLYEPWHDKTNKVTVRPEKTQVSPVWSGLRSAWAFAQSDQSSLSA